MSSVLRFDRISAMFEQCTNVVSSLTEVLELHRNQMTGTITDNICERLDPDRSYTRLMNLTADCDLVSCECCTACYVKGQLQTAES